MLGRVQLCQQPARLIGKAAIAPFRAVNQSHQPRQGQFIELVGIERNVALTQ